MDADPVPTTASVPINTQPVTDEELTIPEDVTTTSVDEIGEFTTTAGDDGEGIGTDFGQISTSGETTSINVGLASLMIVVALAILTSVV